LELTAEQKQAQQFINSLIKNCWSNPEFKKKLIDNPVKTIEKVTGKKSKLPKGFRVKVEDQSETSKIYLNIPVQPK